MGMTFELHISGLCAIVLKSPPGNDRPEHPLAIDVVCPQAHGHVARLSYLPTEVVADKDIAPDLFVDPRGVQIASLPLSEMALDLSFAENSNQFELEWGPAESKVPAKGSEDEQRRMQWVPRLRYLGFDEFSLAGVNGLPAGAAARLKLPKGKLISRNIVRDRDGEIVQWEFPATTNGTGEPLVRALANEVVFLASDVNGMELKSGGKVILSAFQDGGTLSMTLSNDMAKVPPDFMDGSVALGHLVHFGDLVPAAAAPGPAAPDGPATKKGFQAPKVHNPTQHTGHPICNGVMVIDQQP